MFGIIFNMTTDESNMIVITDTLSFVHLYIPIYIYTCVETLSYNNHYNL